MNVDWWVGGYGADMGGSAEGVAALRTRADGALEYLGVAAEAPSPGFLASRAGILYAALEARAEVASFQTTGTGLVHTGTAPAGGSAPCHLGPYGDLIVASCYGDGRLGVIGLGDDGAVGELLQTIEGAGSGPRQEQDGPHAHSSFAVDDSTILSLDLGADRVLIHSLRAGRVEPTGSVEVPPGTGPRDILRHPSGVIFVLGELSGELLSFDWDGSALEVASTVVLAGATEGDHGAGLVMSADGRFLYSGLRGSNRITVTQVEGTRMKAIGSVDCGGDWPRHLDVDGELLHVANQRSSSVASFRVGTDGIPVLVGTVEVPSPTYLLKAR